MEYNDSTFYQKVIEYGIFYKKRRFNKDIYIKNHLDYMFKGIEVKNKKVLDVGGGAGLLALYAAKQGAKMAICLEPELEGSTSGVRRIFEKFKKEAGINTQAENLNETFQSFCLKNSSKFNIVIFHNSINHLDEPACEILLKDSTAEDKYINIFKQLNDLLEDDGVVVIADCGRRNFFNDLGLKSPFAMSIEWHKHQNPSTWLNLLKKSGFQDIRTLVEWTSHEALGSLGKWMLGNRVFAYFLFSHFKIVLKKK